MKSLVSIFLYALAASAETTYDLVKDYSGESFFDDWIFYGHYDNLTDGDAIFVNRSLATSDKLAYVDSSTNRAIIKVDNTSTVEWNYKRNTVRISSTDRFEVGSLFVADFYHVPYGCSVWPAWWSEAPDWPTGGEIDTFEGVNLVTRNQMALHTEDGCEWDANSSTSASSDDGWTQTSHLVNSTDCYYDADSNDGCVITDPDTDSYGEGFAKAGGGVYITEFAESGISIWFFNRSSIPSSISANSSINMTELGTPVANWPKSGCDIDTYFTAQHLVFDITLCGDFAGDSTIFAETCSGTCYDDYVVGDGSTYGNAYFDISYVRVYGANGTDTLTSSSIPASRPDGWMSAVLGFGMAALLWAW
ncbi:glycoside hydrolase family 16 protein [Fistulina hepatica ATCC 64428]|uniref:Glycoside hydrolase family 16 protein n=1 Tax=Fistulina hepatica ATCC 64428 TaxID=1128425 RepID=A0A0D7AKU1_9AGAR|nr:glycoside hydrolase family 16 protein [Fistulina hepatica ATCC 64428]